MNVAETVVLKSVFGTLRSVNLSTVWKTGAGKATHEDFLYAVLPIAYASLEINELTEVIADPQKGIAISEGLKRDLQYVLGEF